MSHESQGKRSMDSPDEPTVRVVALVLAGGVGARMRGPVPKQFLVVRNKPVLVYTLETFQRAVAVEDIIVVSLPEWVGIVEQYVKDCGLTKVRSVVPGGASGFESIRCGLRYLEKQYSPEDIILIHDGVRPLLTEEVINANIAGVEKYGNAVTVVPATEALLHTDDGESSSRVVERSHVMRTQTPQSLRLRDLSLIHRQADEMGIHDSVATCTLLIETGHVVHAVAGDNSNFKLTSPEDVALFEAYLDAKGMA